MLNIVNMFLTLLLYQGGGIFINKGMPHGNFVYLLSLLSVWLLPFSFLINQGEKGLFAFLNITLIVTVLIALKTKNLFLFYVFFEFRIIPITIMVFLFGYQPEKLQAAFSLLIYTVVGSLPLLLCIVFMSITMIRSTILTIPITLGFMIKTPIYLVHTWLPKAHVEAPVGGSIILAGVLLKLGSYGLLVFLPLVTMNGVLRFYLRVSMIGSTVASVICLRQGDLKLLVAYSSVVHMGVVTLGFIRGRELGYSCAFIIVLAHGLSSPFLFAFAYWLYSTSHSRLILNNARTWPLLILWLFTLVSLNIGVPPRLTVWAEVLMSIRIIFLITSAWPIIMSIFLLGGAYNLYLYVSCIHCKGAVHIRSIDAISHIALLQVAFLGYGSFLCLDLFHIS